MRASTKNFYVSSMRLINISTHLSNFFHLHFARTSILFLFFSVYLLYVVFLRCFSDKYFIQSLLKNYIEKLYFLHTYAELMHQNCVRNFLITFIWKLCSTLSFSKLAKRVMSKTCTYCESYVEKLSYKNLIGKSYG